MPTAISPPPSLKLTVADCARELHVAESTVLNLLKSGRLRGYRVGHQWRLDPQDFAQYVASIANRPIAEALHDHRLQEFLTQRAAPRRRRR